MLQKIHDTLTQAMTMAATAASRQQLLQRTLRKAVAALNPPRAAAISARDHREDRDREDGSNEVRQQEPIQWENHAFFWWEKHGKSWKITSFDGKTMRKSWTITMFDGKTMGNYGKKRWENLLCYGEGRERSNEQTEGIRLFQILPIQWGAGWSYFEFLNYIIVTGFFQELPLWWLTVTTFVWKMAIAIVEFSQ